MKQSAVEKINQSKSRSKPTRPNRPGYQVTKPTQANNTETLNHSTIIDVLQSGTARSKPVKPTNVLVQEAVLALPRQFKGLSHQIEVLQELTATHIHGTTQENITLERVHDRLESILLEQRTTNILLSRLIAVHESMLDVNEDEIHAKAESYRMNSYGRVYNGE